MSSCRTRASKCSTDQHSETVAPIAPLAATTGTNVTSFYRRPLPTQLIAFSSEAGRVIFRQALDSGGMESYFALSEQFHTQSDPAFCGLGTLTMCLNALSLDPQRTWRGPWRWFSEELLDCCVPLERARKDGITLAEFVCLAKCNGATAEAYHADDSNIEHFRAVVKAAATTVGTALVSAFCRQTLGQTGIGHYSPIGGYHAERDLVLVMDVARFKYPPYWCPLALLWESMTVKDAVTNKSRGFVLLKNNGAPMPSLWRFAAKQSYSDFVAPLLVTLPALLEQRASQLETPQQIVQVVLDASSDVLSSVTTWHEQLGVSMTSDHAALIQNLMAEVRQTEMFAVVHAVCPDGKANEAATVILLLLPPSVFCSLNSSVQDTLARLRSNSSLTPGLHAEIAALRTQLNFLNECCSTVECS